MNKQAAASQMTRSEQETENEANRLIAQVDASTCLRSRFAHPRTRWIRRLIESNAQARDLADALRGLAQERKRQE
jgi:hypothetical protein